MIPDVILTVADEILLDEGRSAVTLALANSGDRPLQEGCHLDLKRHPDA
jgi:urease beta subunit